MCLTNLPGSKLIGFQFKVGWASSLMLASSCELSFDAQWAGHRLFAAALVKSQVLHAKRQSLFPFRKSDPETVAQPLASQARILRPCRRPAMFRTLDWVDLWPVLKQPLRCRLIQNGIGKTV